MTQKHGKQDAGIIGREESIESAHFTTIEKYLLLILRIYGTKPLNITSMKYWWVCGEKWALLQCYWERTLL